MVGGIITLLFRASSKFRLIYCFFSCKIMVFFKSSLQVGGGVWPYGLSYIAFNLPSHPDHKYIWFRVGISVTFFYTKYYFLLLSVFLCFFFILLFKIHDVNTNICTYSTWICTWTFTNQYLLIYLSHHQSTSWKKVSQDLSQYIFCPHIPENLFNVS
jgi:hypothetical protein